VFFLLLKKKQKNCFKRFVVFVFAFCFLLQ